MRIKKSMATFVAASMVFSSVAPVFAADSTTTSATKVIGSDVVGTKYYNPVQKLAALGVVTGYQDGSIKPDNTITRAEFAAIVVRELGLGDAVAASSTKFKDVPASHWASGIINVAVGEGIIKGYPDGTFKPEAPVTYAEAVTMLVRMLGYAPSVDESKWPASYLSKAASIGVTDSVKFSANAQAKRGDIMTMAANSLEIDMMEQTSFGSDTKWEVKKGKTILSDKFDVEVIDKDSNGGKWPVVDRTSKVDLSGLKANEVKFKDYQPSSKFKVVSQQDPNQFLGQEVKIWVNDDDEILYMEANKNQDVIYDEIDSVVDPDTIHLDAADEDYDFASGATVYANFQKLNTTDLTGYAGKKIKLVVNEDDQITFAEVVDYEDSDVVKSINGEEIKFYNKDAGEETVNLKDKDYVIVKNGAQVAVSALQPGDVINIFHPNGVSDDYYIVATSKKVTGKVEKIVSSGTVLEKYDVYVGGKKYDFAASGTYSNDGGKTYKKLTPTELKDFVGADVTLYLDNKGEVRHIESKTNISSKKVGVLLQAPVYDQLSKKYRIRLVNGEGKELSFDVKIGDLKVYDQNGNEKTTDADKLAALGINGWTYNGANDTIGEWMIPVEYKLDSNGGLKQLDILSFVTDTITEDKYIDESNDAIYANNNWYKVTSSTVIFDLTGQNKVLILNDPDTNGLSDGDTVALDDIEDAKTVSWATIETKDKLNFAYVLDNDDVKYMFVVNAGTSGKLTTSGQYGLVKNLTWKNGDDAVTIVKSDGTEEVLVTNETLNAGDFIYYELNADGEIEDAIVITNKVGSVLASDTAIDEAGLESGTVLKVYKVTEIGNGLIKAVEDDTSNNASFLVNSDTKYFDAADKVKISGVAKDDYIVVVDTDDDDAAANFVIKLDK